MFNSAIANSYAEVLYNTANEENTKTDILYQLKELLNYENTEVARILTYPLASKEVKYEVVDELGRLTKISILIQNLMKILIESNKFKYFFEIANEYQNVFKVKEDIAVVNVAFARQQSSEMLDKIQNSLQEKFQKNTTLLTTIDESLIGGIKIEFNGEILDNTIKKHLNDLKK